MIWGYHYFRKHPFAKNGRCHPIFHISDRKIHPKKVPTYSKDGLQFFSRLLATLGKKEHQAPPPKKKLMILMLTSSLYVPSLEGSHIPLLFDTFESMIFRTSLPVGIWTHSHWVGYDSSPPKRLHPEDLPLPRLPPPPRALFRRPARP